MQVDGIKTRVEKRLCCQRLKVICDEPLSNLAFNLNLRRHTVASLEDAELAARFGAEHAFYGRVRTCMYGPGRNPGASSVRTRASP